MQKSAPHELKELAAKCYQCGICSGACPIARVKADFLPRKIVLDSATGFSSKVVFSGSAWNCLTCALCQVKCPMNVDFLGLMRELRKDMNQERISCVCAHSNILKPLYNIMKNENMQPKRSDLIDKNLKINEKSETLYFMGCLPYFDAIFNEDVGFDGLEIANNTIRLLNIVGTEPAVLDGEKCCGHDFFWRGEDETFEELARQNIENLKKYKTIVVSCPECYRTLALDYKERFGAELNVKHISQFLAERINKLDGDGNSVITFHDSCRLGRHMNVYEDPRRLLHHVGYQLKEMEHNREDSLCCGVSCFVSCDDEAKEIRKRKLEEALKTGAKIMVTTCPKCQIHLKCLQKDLSEAKEGKYDIEIKDFSTVLVEKLEK